VRRRKQFTVSQHFIRANAAVPNGVAHHSTEPSWRCWSVFAAGNSSLLGSADKSQPVDSAVLNKTTFASGFA